MGYFQPFIMSVVRFWPARRFFYKGDVMDKSNSIKGGNRRRAVRRRGERSEAVGALVMKLDAALVLAGEEAGPGGKGYDRIADARAALEGLVTALRRICPDIKPLYAEARLPAGNGAGKAGRLTPKEREIVVLITEGLADKEISRRLDISVNTVHAHRNNIARKLDIHKQTDLVRFAIQERIVRV
ncbi:MAG: two component LuxR family transcriptional regulator [Elusimicrobia bacterium]|nr:MAG: two component LuxR family transcriptional regulator [Elusimicrobiota bacterium]KAF0152710.1 MAG: two component LuxR family transcriptional regulator [Elusimicrobiota bacterium]